MKSTKKKFNRALFDKHDESAKTYADIVLSGFGFQANRNPDRYGVDLMACKNGEVKFFVETEIKTYIKPNKPFSFKTLNLPARKGKYISLLKPTLFMLFSECGRSYLCVWSTDIKAKFLKEVENRYVAEGELFYSIPMSLVHNNLGDAIKMLEAS